MENQCTCYLRGCNVRICSHVALQETKAGEPMFVDLACLEKAAQMKGLELVHQKNYHWYQRHVGDYCFDAQTSVMTEEGLVKLRDVNKETMVMTLNPSNSCVEFQAPTVLIENKDYVGGMVYFHGKALDQAVTLNHRCYVRRIDFRPEHSPTQYCFKTAGEILACRGNGYMHYAIPRAGAWAGEAPNSIRIEGDWDSWCLDLKRIEAMSLVASGVTQAEVASSVGVTQTTVSKWVRGRHPKHSISRPLYFDTGDWMEFLGWYIAEGNCCKTKNYRIDIWQSETANPEKHARIERLLSKMGIHSRKIDDGFEIISKRLYKHLEPLGMSKYKTKHIPAYAKRMSVPLLERLMYSLVAGDGSEGRRFYTNSNRLRDDFIEIAIKCGYGCTFGRGGGKEKPVWDVCFSKRTVNHRISKASVKSYKGNTYCVSVPNGIIMTERNGRLSWSGNSIPPGMKVEELGNNAKFILRANPETKKKIMATQYGHEPYEIGFVEDPNNPGAYCPIYDFYNHGYGIDSLVGDPIKDENGKIKLLCPELKQCYDMVCDAQAANESLDGIEFLTRKQVSEQKERLMQEYPELFQSVPELLEPSEDEKTWVSFANTETRVGIK